LAHFWESGQISKVCGDADPIVLFERLVSENAELIAKRRIQAGDAADAQDVLAGKMEGETEAFFGIARNSSEIRAVTCYGIFQIMRNDKVKRIGDLPELNRRGALLITPDVAGIVYLGTSLNQARSLSGITPLIVFTQP
jgi:hypothetical protein